MAIRFHEDEKHFSGRYADDVRETIFLAYKPFVFRIVICLLVGFTGRLLLLSNANLIGIWVDSLCQGAACSPIPKIFQTWKSQDFFQILVLVTGLGFLCTAFFRISFSRLSCLAVSQLYDEVTFRTSRFAIPFFDHTPVGRIVTRFSSDYGNVFRLFGGPLAEFGGIIFDLVAMVALIIIASPWYLPFLILTAISNYFIYSRNLDLLREVRRQMSRARSPSIAHFAETAQGASTIRTFVRQKSFYQRFLSLDVDYQLRRLSSVRVINLFSAKMSISTAVLYLMMGLGGWWLVSNGWSGIGGLGVALTFVTLSSASIQMFFEWMAQFEEAMTGVERLNEYLRKPIEPGLYIPAEAKFSTDHPKLKRPMHSESPLRGSKHALDVRVEDLWLRYSDDGPDILKGVSFQIKAGERVGVIGRTGSGKTSLIQSLFYLYRPFRGFVAIGGAIPKLHENDQTGTMDLAMYRQNIALISQEPTLFKATLRENLDLQAEHTDAELCDAIFRVGLKEWYESTARSLDFQVEERGRNLSSGEKQMLCVARCILQDAPVIVMDEATSSIDPQSEAIMVRATEEFFAGRTQIIIAHRLSTLDSCDRVLWLDNGELKLFDKPEVVFRSFRENSPVPSRPSAGPAPSPK